MIERALSRSRAEGAASLAREACHKDGMLIYLRKILPSYYPTIKK
jgi:hypothetical protein